MAECNKSIVLSEEKYKAILALLHNPSERVCPRFRHWVKNRRFRIMDLPEMGLTGVLAIPDRESFVSMSWHLSVFLTKLHWNFLMIVYGSQLQYYEDLP